MMQIVSAPRHTLPWTHAHRARRTICQASYRWSAGDGDGRRKRESVLDNVEPEEEERGQEGQRRDAGRRKGRRRQSGRASGDAARSGNGAPPAAEAGPSGWEDSEWGPAEAPPPPEETAWGWGEESWQPDGPAARDRPNGAQPSSAWDEELERRERSQRRPPREPAAEAYDPDEEDAYEELGEDAYEEVEEGEEMDGRRGGGPSGGAEPDIALLSPQELDRLLPVVPFSAQASFFNGGAAQAVQRWSASLALTLLLSKAALLAATSLTWPLWWPWAQAATKNYGLRKQAASGGLWRTQILEVEARGRPRPRFARDEGDDDADGGENGAGRASSPRSRFSTMRTTRVVLGDPGGARTELVIPHDARFDSLEPGQPAELVVLSDSPAFQSFRAVKDVYLPQCGLWLSEYPYVERTEFLEVSLDIEREAAAAAAAAAGGDDYPPGSNDEDGYYYAPPPPPPRR